MDLGLPSTAPSTEDGMTLELPILKERRMGRLPTKFLTSIMTIGMAMGMESKFAINPIGSFMKTP